MNSFYLFHMLSYTYETILYLFFELYRKGPEGNTRAPPRIPLNFESFYFPPFYLEKLYAAMYILSEQSIHLFLSL